MIKEFTTRDMSDLLEADLNSIKDNGKSKTEVTLENPTTKSKFPCRLIHTPLDSVRRSENAIPILKDPRILATAVEANRRVLTPLWLELLEEGKADGSIKTNYVKEISELLPLINFWFMPSIFPATAEEIHNKFIFVIEALSRMGLPLMKGDDMKVMAEKFIKDIYLK